MYENIKVSENMKWYRLDPTRNACSVDDTKILGSNQVKCGAEYKLYSFNDQW